MRCSDCPAEYHVSCAWKAGHKFGFEVQAVSLRTLSFHICYLLNRYMCKSGEGKPAGHNDYR